MDQQDSDPFQDEMDYFLLLAIPVCHQFRIKSLEVIVLEVGITSLGNMPYELLKEFEVLYSDFNVFVGTNLGQQTVVLLVARAATVVFLE